MNCFNSKRAGYLKKTHGKKGEFILYLDYSVNKDFKLKKWAFLKYEGMLIPFSIEYYSILDDRNIIIKFGQINNIDEAKKFIGCEFHVENTLKWLIESEKKNLIGFLLYDCEDHLLGTITEIIPIKNNPLVQVKNNKNTFLVPFHQQAIEKIDYQNRKVFLKISRHELITQ